MAAGLTLPAEKLEEFRERINAGCSLTEQDMMPKITQIKNEIKSRGLDVLVEADGGISEKTAAQASRAGTDICVSGTGVFKAADTALAIKALKEA